MRTCAAVFRSTCLEILKNLSIGGGSSGTHFIRCIRSDLESNPRGFYREVVRQQVRALAVLDTAKAKQQGYPYRIPFQEFLRRYKFLAFDFDENVELTKDNCRLLLIRLKMEGWLIGKTKVFLKYYNEEYLSRLYETQVKKIVKVQCMLRAFLARKTLVSKTTKVKKDVVKKASIKKKESVEMSQDQAAVMIQKAYRGHSVRKEMTPLLREEMDQETKDFMMFYSHKWRAKSIFQVLLRYRAARYQDLVHFSQQVHLYNQMTVGELQVNNERAPFERIDPGIKPSSYLGPMKPPQVHKLPFDIHHELPFFDTTYLNDPSKNRRKAGSISSLASDDELEAWDAPLRRQTVPWANTNIQTRDVQVQTTNSPHHLISTSNVGGQSLINTPFSRDPKHPICCPPEESLRNKDTSDFKLHANNRNTVKPIADLSCRSNHHSSGSLRSKKKQPPPPIPYNHAVTSQMRMSHDNYDLRTRNKKNVNDNWTFEDGININIRNNNSNNPIQELQMLGRKRNSNNSDDDPPFNFQAMLRKTHHQRASMKRTAIYESYSQSPPFKSTYHASIHENESKPDVAFKSNDSRGDSPEWSPNELVRMSEKYGREDVWNEEKKTFKKGQPITTELAPGIIVQGYVADL